jgi:hypothetical protein
MGGKMEDTYLTVRVDSATKDRIAAIANREHRSSASQIKYMLEQALEQMDGGKAGQAQELRQYMQAQP